MRRLGSRNIIIDSVKPVGGDAVQEPDRDIDAYIALPVARHRFGDISTQRGAGRQIR